MGNDIYEISGRVKNIIAKQDISMSPAGNVLVNYFSLFLKDLYDFAEKYDHHPHIDQLKNILVKSESIPLNIIKVSSPDGRLMTLYGETMNAKVRFKTNEAALKHFTREYEDLGAKYSMTGDEFWLEAESSSDVTEDYRKIMRLNRSIQMCKYLIQKEKDE